MFRSGRLSGISSTKCFRHMSSPTMRRLVLQYHRSAHVTWLVDDALIFPFLGRIRIPQRISRWLWSWKVQDLWGSFRPKWHQVCHVPHAHVTILQPVPVVDSVKMFPHQGHKHRRHDGGCTRGDHKRWHVWRGSQVTITCVKCPGSILIIWISSICFFSPFQACIIQQCGCDWRQHFATGISSSWKVLFHASSAWSWSRRVSMTGLTVTSGLRPRPPWGSNWLLPMGLRNADMDHG